MPAAVLAPVERVPLRFVVVVFASSFSFSSSAPGSGVFSFPSSVAAAADAPDAPRVRGASDVGTGVRRVRVALAAFSDGSGGTGGTASSASSCFTAALLRAPRRPFTVAVGGRESSGSLSSLPSPSSATSMGFARVPRRVVLGALLAVVDAPPAGVGVFARVRRVGLVSASSVFVVDAIDESVAVRVRRVERVG